MSLDECVEIIIRLFPDAPCNYNGMDELADCEFCEENCGKASPNECWKNAIVNDWWKNGMETCKGCKHNIVVNGVQVCWLPFSIKSGNINTVSCITDESERCFYYDEVE